ncbi:hypothetical protein B296_00006758 [Ensete ventricosum]|uniref:Uncharacterized protein n=1 Tax=Ensete ventricosum TaxID=4639 RepID=A0A427AN99_ENSVE|nr:hypothetical protein B296_00006758 [Ensete ventricosum]
MHIEQHIPFRTFYGKQKKKKLPWDNAPGNRPAAGTSRWHTACQALRSPRSPTFKGKKEKKESRGGSRQEEGEMKTKPQPLEVIGDLVLETGRGVDLPFHQLFLEPIASDLAQGLRSTDAHEEKFRTKRERGNRMRGRNRKTMIDEGIGRRGERPPCEKRRRSWSCFCGSGGEDVCCAERERERERREPSIMHLI